MARHPLRCVRWIVWLPGSGFLQGGSHPASSFACKRKARASREFLAQILVEGDIGSAGASFGLPANWGR